MTYRNRYEKLRETAGPEVAGAYGSWVEMRKRCWHPTNNPRNKEAYVGVTFDHSWDTFDGFLADMGPRPEGTSLDRIDPFGNYEPSNCRWANTFVQARNKKVKRMSMKTAKEIRRRYEPGKVSQQSLADEYNVSQRLISEIVLDRIWF